MKISSFKRYKFNLLANIQYEKRKFQWRVCMLGVFYGEGEEEEGAASGSMSLGHGILCGPLFGVLVVGGCVGFVHARNLWHKRIVRIWIAEQRTY